MALVVATYTVCVLAGSIATALMPREVDRRRCHRRVGDHRRNAGPAVATVRGPVESRARAGVIRLIGFPCAHVERVAGFVSGIDRETADAVGPEAMTNPSPLRVRGVHRVFRAPDTAAGRADPKPATPVQLAGGRNRECGDATGNGLLGDPIGHCRFRTQTDPGTDLAGAGAAHGDVLKHPVLLRVGLCHERRARVAGKRLLVGEQIVEPERGEVLRRRRGDGRRITHGTPLIQRQSGSSQQQQRDKDGEGPAHLNYFFVTFT